MWKDLFWLLLVAVLFILVEIYDDHIIYYIY